MPWRDVTWHHMTWRDKPVINIVRTLAHMIKKCNFRDWQTLYHRSVFIFLPEKMKSARETIFCTFCFFPQMRNIFLAHFTYIFSGILEFSRADLNIFSRVYFSFSPVEILKCQGIFEFWRGNSEFFLELNFAVFFSGIIFLSVCFQQFFSASFKTSRAEYWKFSRFHFFLSA